ncbi:exosome nuclease subunit [Parahypoxylon ruwenzoriense]
MDPSKDFKSVQDKIQSALIATTRLTNQIAAEDLGFQRTSNPDVEEQLDDTSARLLTLASSLITSATKATDLKPPKLEDGDDVDVHWSRIVDVVDTLLEKADTCLDEYTGMVKRKTAPTDQSGPLAKKPKPTSLDHAFRRANIIKPQHAFEVKSNHLDMSPWKPVLTEKPHAFAPLERSLETFNDENQLTQYSYTLFFLPASLFLLLEKLEGRWSTITEYKHPYEAEILELEYPEAVFQVKEPIKYQPIETTAATFVDTFEGVLDMLEELKEATEIAIDTEHHDFRTYTGLLSLMQISTRDKDWIIDTLQPWRHKLEVLNEVFANPKIVKVLHGAYMDIVWLQRDCGLYIVGLFDTFEAAVALQYPGRSLAYLLKRFVDFDADKKYQLADWRIRPIPEEMFYYARSDTHYLLYIYDSIRNELLKQDSEDTEQSLMFQVLGRSKETSLRRHEGFNYDAEGGQGPLGWYNLLLRQSAGKFSREQFAVYRAVHKWRDEVARREDESPLFVMSNSTLFDIVRRMPPDPKALHSLLDVTSHIAKREVSNLFNLISKAKTEGENGPSVAEVIRRNAQPTIGIAEVAQAFFPQLRTTTETPETKDLISQTSKLWGKIAMSSRWEELPYVETPRAAQFELPWAHFVKSSTLLADSNARQQPAEQSFIPLVEAKQHPELRPNGNEAPVDDEFTLKSGLKRKAPEIESDSESGEVNETPSKPQPSSGTTPSAEEIAVPDIIDSEEERKRGKKSKRAEKKARKQARKEHQRTQESAKNAAGVGTTGGMTTRGDEDEEPFDYSKAKSVLNATRATNDTSRATKFNPYGMTVEGPKPARKMHGEKAGKSATFRK